MNAPAKATPNVWRNRIVGTGAENPEQLLANPRNWRTHSAAQKAALSGVLNEVGVVQNVIVNQRTGYVVDGHARIELAIAERQPEIPVVYVDLTDDEEALILATLDPISAMAGKDAALLASLLDSVHAESAGLQALLDEMTEPGADPSIYTAKIEAPTYEPKNEPPPIGELVDTSKTAALLAAIEAAPVGEDEKRFLRLAAERHTVFDFAKVADYYAHASPDMQELMEASALVIIDFDKAIANGFVTLTSRIMAQYGAEAESDDGYA